MKTYPCKKCNDYLYVVRLPVISLRIISQRDYLYTARCTECGNQGPEKKTMQEAVEAWNLDNSPEVQ